LSVSVVICAYSASRHATLRAGVAETLLQLRPVDEVVLVVDHNPELLEFCRVNLTPQGVSTGSTREPQLRIVTNRNAQGLSGARNTGVAESTGELVVFLDDDAVPRSGWLTELTAAFVDSTVIGTGGLARPAWEHSQPAWFPDEFLWVVGCSYRGLPELPAEIRNPIGANMAFRREVILRVGGFTSGIGRVGRTPLGCEETELAIRATAATGGRILQQPSAAVDHLVPAERTDLRYFVRRCWAEGISKAVVSRLAGSDAALESERRYTTRTLPLGFIAGLREGFNGDLNGFSRAAAIVGGLTVTVAGYLRGLAARPKPS
jgi:GT2 family glycosyltransferase